MYSQLGVTGQQRCAIRLLGRFPRLTGSELAELMMVHRSTVSGIVRRLHAAGLLETPRPRQLLEQQTAVTGRTLIGPCRPRSEQTER